MQLRNTPDNYGQVAKWLHWSVALLFLASYCSVYYRHWFTEKETPENWLALQLHLSFGVTIAVFVILRILWRIFNQPPDPEPGPKFAHTVAHIAHYVLYGIMIVLPITGYIGTGVNTEFFSLFEIPKFASTDIFQTVVVNGMGLTFEEFEKPVDFIHKNMGEYIVWVLILGHALAALYHHFINKDRTLIKMTSGKTVD